jgi:multidrug efflux pump subunit AcrA (membrane-fusion protein)
VVTTAKLKEKVGQHVKKGDLIAQVHELKTVRVEIPVSERQIAGVKVGQRVVLKARAYPGNSFLGRVTTIAPIAAKEDEGREGRTILVTTQIENPSLLLKPEMPGNAETSCGKQPIINLLTRRLARYIRVEFWSWW